MKVKVNRSEALLCLCSIRVNMSALQFNSVLLEISNAMSADQLNEMKFLVLQEIGKRNLEKIGSGRELFQLFRERGKLSEDNTAFLSKLLKEIKRQDLSDKIDNFSIQPEPDDGLSEEEKGRLKYDMNVLVRVSTVKFVGRQKQR